MPRSSASLFVRFALLCGLLLAGRADETGLPLRRNFATRDYEEHNQNWCAVQDKAGVLYVGNRDVVLRHDGIRWQAIPTGGLFIRGIDVDTADRIWIGGVNQLGYLDDDGRGSRTFTSLIDKLPEAERDFRDIRRVYTTSHGVYFITDDRLLRWHDGAFTVARPGRMMASRVGDDIVVSVVGETSLRAWREGQWREFGPAPQAQPQYMPFVAARAAGGCWIGTLRQGLFVLEDGKLTPFPTEADAALKTGTIYHGRVLRDGSLAIALRQGGLLILGPDGRLKHHLSGDNGGLPARMVLGTHEDHDGGLWALLDTGMTRLNWPSPITTFGAPQGLRQGMVMAIHRHAGRLYAGTAEGLFVLEPGDTATNPPRAARFVPAGGITTRVWQMASAGDQLIVGTENALYALAPSAERAEQLPQPADARWTISVHVPRSAPDRLYAGVGRGLQQFRRGTDGQWQFEGPVPGLDVEARSLVEARDGALWLGTQSHGFVRVLGLAGTGSAAEGPPRIEIYRQGEHGLDAPAFRGSSLVTASAGDVVFFAGTKILRFDAESHRFAEIDASRQRPLSAAAHVNGSGSGQSGHLWVRSLDPAPDAGPWKGRKLWRVSDRGEWLSLPWRAIEPVGESTVYFHESEPDGEVLWVGGSDGLVRAEVPAALIQPRPFAARIVQVADPRGQFQPLAGATPLTVPHDINAFAFALASTAFASAEQRFQTRLEGREQAWTAFSPNPAANYTGLAPGRYTLQARARDADGRISETATFPFVVLPPWWLTGWAWAAYAGLAVLVVAGIVRLRSRQLRIANEKLEMLVQARTGELRASEQHLRVARDGAEAANRAKTSFLANMSHELRTPLNAVLGYAQIVLRDQALPGEHRRRVGAIVQGGEHLLSMINEVLDLSKIEADKIELAPRPVSLPRLLAALSEMFQLRAAERSLAFGFRQLTPLPGTVLADEGRLRQVLINLLENAVKFTPAGGRVDLEVGRDGPWIRFAVRDTGSGIPPGQLQAIFKPFHQAATPALAQQGAGLGLAISQRLVGLMGGTIQVESEAGRGSHFWFDVVLPEATGGNSADPFGGAIVTGYRGAPRRVLIVDDETTNRQVLREMLEPLGFICAEAINGETAIAAATAAPPDLILMDIRMPGIDGLAAAHRLRALPATAGVKIIAISASVFASDREQAMAQGCDEFLPKPFRVALLLTVLGRVLALEWVHAPAAPATPATGAPAGVATRELPDTVELAALATLAEQGDVIALRARLDSLRTRAPQCQDFIAQLDRLAAEFQMTRLSQLITEARRHSP